jgi:hypothetical protein
MAIRVTPINVRVIDRTGVDKANRQDQADADRNGGVAVFRGFLVALAAEAAICLAVYFIIHAWRLL